MNKHYLPRSGVASTVRAACSHGPKSVIATEPVESISHHQEAVNADENRGRPATFDD